tara:strand:+ start:1293 stop:1544 length:252 start_codon:yes stop_codon:yes gene_type:complete
MSKEKLTKEEQKELDKLQEEILDEAKKVVQDYADVPSELSGSAIHIDYDSSFLDEEWEDDKWKSVTKPEFIQDLIKSRKKKKE